jgi:hypothetical protein
VSTPGLEHEEVTLMFGKDANDERRRLLADDVRRLAGLADFAVGEADYLGAEVPEDVALCVAAWRHWAGKLAVWARGDIAE